MQKCEERLSASSHVCLSVLCPSAWNNWPYFHEIWYSIIFRKFVEKIQVLLKSDKNRRYFRWRSKCTHSGSL